MAKFIVGTDIFREPGDLYLVTVNTVGVMGAGVAKAFKLAHEELYLRYKHDCKLKIITIGHPVIYLGDDGKKYMMFPTKENWKNPSEYNYIAAGLDWIIENIGEEEGMIDPKWKIIIPPLGCGNGGLDFDIVSEMISEASKEIPNEMVVIYPPWFKTSQ